MKNPALALVVAALFCADAKAQVIFNEIHYHPVERPAFNTAGNAVFQGTTTLADFSDDVHEFVELNNPSGEAIDLSGWRITGGVEFTFPSGTSIPAGGFLVVAKNPERIQSVYGISGVLGPYTGKLSNSGDTLRLVTPTNVVSDSVSYQSGFPWAISANQLGADDDFTGLNSAAYQYKGRSLQRVSSTAPSNDPANWVAVRPAIAGDSFADLPTPGAANITSRTVPKPVVVSYSALQVSDNQAVIRPASQVKITCSFSSAASLSNVQVEYFLDNMNAFGEVRNTVAMTALGNGQYTATLPGQATRSIVRYRIKADRGDGVEIVAPRADDPAVVQVGPPTYAGSPAKRVPAPREPWYGYFVTPVRSSAKPIIDVIVPTDGSVVDDSAGTNTTQFNGINGLQAIAYDCKGSPKRTTAENTPSSYPRETPYVPATDRIWNDVVPAVFASNGILYDIQIRFHGSRYNRRPTRKSYKVFFPEYQLYKDGAGNFVSSVFETDKNDYFMTAHGLHQLAGLPLSTVRYVDWYFNNDAPMTRLEQGEYNGELLDAFHEKMQRLNPGSVKEATGEFYKSVGFIVSSNASGEGPYGNGNAWPLPAAGFWTELQRYDYTYTLQNHGWKGAKPIRDMIAGMWTARGDSYLAPNPNIANTRAWFLANWDVDTELTSMALGNWMCPWDDTTQNHYYWRRANGKWVRLLWDFDGMYGSSAGTAATQSLYLGEVNDPGNNFRGPHYVKDSFIKAFRNEYKQRMWFLNNTLLDPQNLQTLKYANASGATVDYYTFIQAQSGGFAVTRFNNVNSLCGLGTFYKPTRPINTAPATASAVLPGASLTASTYGYNAAFTHTAAPTVSPHTKSKWEIRSAAGTYDNPVYIATSTTDLTSLPIPFGELTYGQTYFWRVTYFDADGHPSISSAESSFSYGSASATAGNVTINEVMAENLTAVANGADHPDYVELKNNTAADIDLSGWNLTDDELLPTRYTFPAGTTIAAGGYLVVWCDSNTASPGLHAGFSLSRKGQRVILVQGGSVRDAIVFGPQASDSAIGRVVDGTGAWTLVEASPGAANSSRPFSTVTSTLKINEWMAVPASGDDWFEIQNSGTQPVALAGLWLSDTPGTPKISQIPALSFVAPGGCVRFDADGTNSGFSSANFKLATGGDSIVLTTADGISTIDSISFGAQTPGVSQGRFPDGNADIVSFPISASPGDNNWLPAPVRINEALSASVAPLEDYVEIHNPTTSDVDISNWWLSDDHSARQKYQFPAGTIIPAGGYLVVAESQFNIGPNAFSLSSLGDEIVLTAADAAGVQTGYRSQFNFGAAADNVAFGYVPTAGAPEFWSQVSRTPGAANSRPKIGPVVINEVHYHPPRVAGGDNVRDEFIELHNFSSAPVSIAGWKLKGGSNFTFAQDTSVGAGSYILVVGFDPTTDTASLEAFRTTLNVSPDVQIYGPFSASLGNETASVELAYPVTNAMGVTRFVNADKVEYADFAPWPVAADGNGPSLQRSSVRQIGNDAANWTAGTPTPGRVNSGQTTSNTPPQAIDDNLPAAPLAVNGGSIAINVLGNDSDPDGDVLTVTGVTQGSSGSVVITGPGTVTYNPGAGYNGNDSFTYTASDGFGGESTATVRLANAIPAAVGDSFHPPAGLGPQTYAVLGNDSDADAGDTLTIVGISNGAKGAVTTDGTTVTYTPGAGYDGNDSFTYTLADGRGGTATAMVTLTNAAPIAVADNAGTVRGPVTINVLANDSDGDGDPVIIASATNGQFGTVTVNGGTLTYTPGATFRSVDSFSYTISDGRASAAATVSISLSDTAADKEAMSGDQVPGEPAGTVFATFGTPSINSTGQAAFLATMKSPTRQVKSGIFAGAPLQAIASKGSAAPGISGATFSVFKDPVLNKHGNVAFLATVAGVPKNADTGIWFKGLNGLELIAREGMAAADVAGGTFASFLSLALPDTGRVVFTATLTKGRGGVTPKNDVGVWMVGESGELHLLVREGDTVSVNGVDRVVKTVAIFGPVNGSPGQRRGFNSAGEVLLRLGFTDAAGAIVRAKDDGTFDGVALGSSNIGVLANAQLSAFGLGALCNDGTAVFRTTLKSGTAGVSAANNVAILSGRDNADLRLVARTGGEVPGLPGASFKSLLDPVSDANGDVAFVGTMKSGLGGVTPKSDVTLWVARDGALSLVVREGDDAPGVNGGKFAAFTSLAFPSSRGVAFVGALAPKLGGVTKANDTGLWAQDQTGALRLLIREGQTIDVNGAPKKLKAFTVLSAVPTSPGQGHSYSENGGFVYRATFTDGSQGVFSVWMP